MPTMEIRLNNGVADAHFRGLTVPTGGDSPTPYELFIASLGTCAALTAAGYCKKHGLPSGGMRILMDVERHPETRLASKINMQLVVPADFPAEHQQALVAAANDCFVKRHLYEQPEFGMEIVQD